MARQEIAYLLSCSVTLRNPGRANRESTFKTIRNRHMNVGLTKTECRIQNVKHAAPSTDVTHEAACQGSDSTAQRCDIEQPSGQIL